MIFCKICNLEFCPAAPATKICSQSCREMSKLRSRTEWRNKNKKIWSGYTKTYRDKNPIRAKLMVIRAKCKKEKLPFDLTEEEILIPTVCPVLDIPLDGSTRDNQWSIDRINPSKGYTKANTRIISMRANRLKNDASILDVERILKYMKESS